MVWPARPNCSSPLWKMGLAGQTRLRVALKWASIEGLNATDNRSAELNTQPQGFVL